LFSILPSKCLDMELLERDDYLNSLAAYYRHAENGNGHTLFLTGEAGIGKTTLVNHFIKTIEHTACVFAGACDSLFTPRPLGPLFDVATQIDDFIDLLKNEKDRSLIFAALVQRLSSSAKPVVLIFEDIHWADEATLDLIKFLARRVYRHKCLFLLTYRDDEVRPGHPLAAVFGELPSGHFSKLPVNRFSREAVDHLAVAKGFTSGQKLFDLTGGNPFYVMEILERGGAEIPERVKDSILTHFHGRNEATKALWEFFSILPSPNIELSIARRIESDFANCIEHCIAAGVIVSRPGQLSFKHELFRMAIEETLSPSRRKSLHKKMLEIIDEVSAGSVNLSQLVHHARYADERELVMRIAPQAAKEAAAVGAHMEASKLYATAIEYTDKNEPALIELYAHHAYECYLTNQLPAALASQQRVLDMWRQKGEKVKEGDTLRFLSRLWWFAGDQRKAFDFAVQAIDVLEEDIPTRERALAYSNLSQLSMLCLDMDNALLWGNEAIELAKQLQDQEIECHALTNIGAALYKEPSLESKGAEHLERSLSIALKNGFHEHAARVYTNLSSISVLFRRYEKAMTVLNEGLKYCEEQELSLSLFCMHSWRARLLFETGKWDEAESIARSLKNNLHHSTIFRIESMAILARLFTRRGMFEEARVLLKDAYAMAVPTGEAQRVIPVLIARLELSWINGNALPLEEIQHAERTLFPYRDHSWYYSEFTYWIRKCGIQNTVGLGVEFTEHFNLGFEGQWKAAAELWEKTGCPYEQALALFDGDEVHQKQALLILNELGASATHEMLKSRLKFKGIKKIPRGPNESTRSNPAQLTNRQIDILVLLKEGLQSAEIANKLFISPKTVDNHISAILSQFDVKSRAKAVVEARKMGIF
jgi:DNA-binding CsgD family transcriptional regulator/tetratricopeptide (TPR) repeat protein